MKDQDTGNRKQKYSTLNVVLAAKDTHDRNNKESIDSQIMTKKALAFRLHLGLHSDTADSGSIPGS